jgi:hypothetical protein
VQGSTFKDLREISAQKLIEIGFDGYAIGGLAVGEGQKEMFEVLDYAADFLPQNKPQLLPQTPKPEKSSPYSQHQVLTRKTLKMRLRKLAEFSKIPTNPFLIVQLKAPIRLAQYLKSSSPQGRCRIKPLTPPRLLRTMDL